MSRAPSVGRPAPETQKPPEFLQQQKFQIGIVVAFPIVGCIFAKLMELANVESYLAQAYTMVFKPPTEWYVLAMGVTLLFFILQNWKAMKVGEARGMYNVEWPHQMLGRREKYSIEYNCVHRAHMHDYEVLPSFLFYLFVASKVRMYTAAFCGLWFTIARLFSSIGYMTGVAKARGRAGQIGYLGLLPLMGITVLTIVKQMGSPYY